MLVEFSARREFVVSFPKIKRIFLKERSLLGILNWELMLPSCDRFLFSMLAVIGAPHLADSLALRDNFELVICRWDLVSGFRPSVLALSLLSLMLQRTLAEWQRVTQSLKSIFKVFESISLFLF